MRDCTQSIDDKKINLFAPDPTMISLDDVAYSLSRKCRFQGATDKSQSMYTVAQHCVLGSRLLPSDLALPFLLHELGEVFLPDIPGPMKANVFIEHDDFTGTWSALEELHTLAILQALGLTHLFSIIHSAKIKEVDLRMLLTEAKSLKGAPPDPWGIDLEPYAIEQIYCWGESEARASWLSTFRALCDASHSRFGKGRMIDP